jgi:hypothetical protein
MARSYKKHPAGGVTTAHSEKSDKRQWHKKMRAKELQKLNVKNKAEEQVIPAKKEISDPWKMGKDGKCLHFTEAQVRKSVEGYINSLKKGIDHGSAHYPVDVKGYFLDCFKTKDINKILSITDKQKEKLVKYIMKTWTRK